MIFYLGDVLKRSLLSSFAVMAGLDPAIHVFSCTEDVDARDI
jgi:hypothetical protein